MKKYYRMKKDIDLKELEKYGYIQWNDCYYKEMENGETINIEKGEIKIFSFDSHDGEYYDYNLIEREYKDKECGYYYEDMGEEYIPDLIKAELVEKY